MSSIGMQFTGDAAPFFAELNKVRGELGGLRGEMKRVSDSISSGFRGLLAGVGVVSTIRAVVDATAEAEAATAQLNNALQAAGANVKLASAEYQAYASQLQRSTTFGDEAIMQVETLLLSFKGLSGGVVKQATQSVLDLSTRMGIDAPAAAKLLGKALADPEKGMQALARAGVMFSDGQKEQIKAMKEAGDLAGAQGRILKELEARFGGAAAAARDTFGGALTGVKNAFGDLLEGKGGINEASSGINALADTLSSPEVQQGFATLIAGLAKFIELAAKAASVVPDTSKNVGVGLAKMFGASIPIEQWDLNEVEKRMRALQSQRDALLQSVPDAQKSTNSGVTDQLHAWNVELNQLKNRLLELKELGRFPKQATGSTGSALGFVTGGVPDGDTESQTEIDKRNKAALKLAEEEYAGRQAVEELITSLHQDELDKRLDLDIAYWQLSQKVDADGAAAIEAENKAYVDAYGDREKERFRLEKETQDSIQTLRVGALNAGIGLLSLLAQKSKAASIALIAIEKARAISAAVRNTGVAITNIMATVPYYAWPAAIASAKALGAAQIGLIAASGAIEIAGVAGGGGSGSGGIAAPAGVQRVADASVQQQGLPSQSAVQVIFAGSMYGMDDFRERVVETVREAVDGRDVVIISPNSRQAMEIREG